MSSKLHQLTMAYSQKEDRILLRIGTQEHTEYRLWLTRRFVRSFWAPLIKVLSGSTQPAKTLQPKVKEAIMAMEHQESVKQSDFTKKHSIKNKNITPTMNTNSNDLDSEKLRDSDDIDKKKPVESESPEDGAVLIIGARIRALKNDLTGINLKLANGSGIEFTLNKKLLHALCHMMIKSCVKAGWKLDLSIGDSQVLVPKNAGQVH